MSQIERHYELARHHVLAGQSYDADEPEGVRTGFNHEMERLEKYAPVEYAITRRYLLRYIPEDAAVADVGVGVGHYSELLARRGSKVHLVDVAPRLLGAAQERLLKAGLEEQILSITHASATDLSFIPDESCDAVLMLGPFYHLSLPEERRKAAAEAHRILRNGGLLFAAGINRMTMLSWIYRDGPESILEELEWLKLYLKTGNFSPVESGVPPTIYLTTIAEFRTNFLNFQEIVLAGVESFAQFHEENLLKLSSEQAEAWLDLIEETGRTPEGLGLTGHFLYIGRK
ncbi:MAG TPA: class I SAM-dependent methyltransferase [Ktedonobacteraceae bacterium]|nr:class I SAM-dependent methyltransferase [Ktedonobacteraceae bacterium]